MKRDPVCKMEIAEEDAVTIDYRGRAYYFCSEGCRDEFLRSRESRPQKTHYDLIIIGGGPAGLTAAVYAAILNIDSFLIARDMGGQAIDSTKIVNYMGFDFITGPDLIAKFEHQLFRSNFLDHLVSEVDKIEPVEDGFRITTSELLTFTAKTLIVATGSRQKKLDVPGEDEFQRKGIFYGNVQDFTYVEGKDVAVIGGGNSAIQLVEDLHSLVRNIHLISDIALTADPALIECVKDFGNLHRYEYHKVVAFQGDGSLSSVVIRKVAEKDTITLPVAGVFVDIGFRANSTIVHDLVRLNEKNEIMIDAKCLTSRPGIFAAGDVTNAYGKRIIIASGEGAKAALASRQYLLDLKKNEAGAACYVSQTSVEPRGRGIADPRRGDPT